MNIISSASSILPGTLGELTAPDRIDGVAMAFDERTAVPVARREVPPQPQLRPPRFLMGPTPPTRDKWNWTTNPPDSAELELTIPGTHVHATYVFQLIALTSRLPLYAVGQRQTAHLPLLERTTKLRPRVTDVTVADYIARAERTRGVRYCRESIEERLPSRTGTTLYTASAGRYVVWDYSRSLTCSACGAAVGMPARSVARIDKFSFRAHCYPKPTFKLIKPSASAATGPIYKFVYDLETTPAPESGDHRMYLGVIERPAVYCTDTGAERYRVVHSARDFMERVGEVMDHCRALGAGGRLQLISFNGARYDDLFLADAWRDFILERFGAAMLARTGYSERKGALTHNTLKLEDFTVEWVDVMRFVPPTSLRALASSMKLPLSKGHMPFKVLNDFVAGGPSAVARDDDGFFALEEYFEGDAEERAITYNYYQEVVPQEDRTPGKDVHRLCVEYCTQDVAVLSQCYDFLSEMFQTYLSHLVTAEPREPGARFDPMTMHSMSTIGGHVLLDSATNLECWGYNSLTDTTTDTFSCEGELHVPVGPVYDYIRQSLYGGWAKPYFQGVLLDPTAPPDLGGPVRRLVAANSTTCVELEHEMHDMSSEYPVAATTMMPVGEGRWVETPEGRLALVEQCLAEPDPMRIPLFFCRAKWKAPAAPVFNESTLPQRVERTNALRWTYWDDPTGTRVYNSLDVWIACRDHIGDAPDSVWTITAVLDLLYFPQGAQLYRHFMRECTKLKQDGAAEGNLQKRTAGKITMNASIGKLGQQVDAQQNVLGDRRAQAVIDSKGDCVRLVGVRDVVYGQRSLRGPYEAKEYIFSVKDSEANRWPITHASFMYAASRLMRLQWSLHTMPAIGTTGRAQTLLSRPFADTFYGDTDSKIQPTAYAQRMPECLRGSQVGFFAPEEPATAFNRPWFNLEPETVSAEGYRIVATGVLAAKKYFCWAYNAWTRSYKLKFRCNGLTRFQENRHKCPLHGTRKCALCRVCTHGQHYVFECLNCVVVLLESESFADEAIPSVVYGRLGELGYKYDTHALPSLTLLDFCRVLVTGRSCQVVLERFDRALSRRTSKLPEFTVRTIEQRRSLNCPRLLRTGLEHLADRPRGARLQPFISGVVAHPHFKHLIPSGSYLLNVVRQ